MQYDVRLKQHCFISNIKINAMVDIFEKVKLYEYKKGLSEMTLILPSL